MSSTTPHTNRTVLVSGATGYIGRALLPALAAAGWSVRGLTRDPDRAARTAHIEGVEWCRWDAAADALDPAWLEGLGAIINLAGENVGEGRWTRARKAALRASRIDATEKLGRAAVEHEVPVLVNASAIGYYGDSDAPATEDAAPGTGWMSTLVVDWEAATRAAKAAGVRVLRLRIGLVIGPGEKPMDNMIPPRPLPLIAGGPASMPMPWVHLDDVVGMIVEALEDERWAGAVNAVGPEPVGIGQFFRTMAGVLGRRYWGVGLPAALLRLGGEMPREMIQRRDVRPERAEALGYRWRYRTVEQAMREGGAA